MKLLVKVSQEEQEDAYELADKIFPSSSQVRQYFLLTYYSIRLENKVHGTALEIAFSRTAHLLERILTQTK